MKKIFLLGVGLMISTVNVNAMQMHDGPFIGINTFKDKCQAVTEDESFRYIGDAKTKVTMNKNFVIATCKADVDDSMFDEIMVEETIIERDDIPCKIAVRKPNSHPPMAHYNGTGGFTVTPSGNINGHCKAVYK
jgi:hypothetical protein